MSTRTTACSGCDRDGSPTKIAIARRTYATDQADLWDALTNAERIPRWFLPVTGDLREGGRYQTEGNAGGVVERCTEPESFAARISQPAVSQHLKVLREAGLVTVRPEGTERFYALDPAGVEAAKAWLVRLTDPLAARPVGLSPRREVTLRGAAGPAGRAPG